MPVDHTIRSADIGINKLRTGSDEPQLRAARPRRAHVWVRNDLSGRLPHAFADAIIVCSADVAESMLAKYEDSACPQTSRYNILSRSTICRPVVRLPSKAGPSLRARTARFAQDDNAAGHV